MNGVARRAESGTIHGDHAPHRTRIRIEVRDGRSHWIRGAVAAVVAIRVLVGAAAVRRNDAEGERIARAARIRHVDSDSARTEVPRNGHRERGSVVRQNIGNRLTPEVDGVVGRIEIGSVNREARPPFTRYGRERGERDAVAVVVSVVAGVGICVVTIRIVIVVVVIIIVVVIVVVRIRIGIAVVISVGSCGSRVAAAGHARDGSTCRGINDARRRQSLFHLEVAYRRERRRTEIARNHPGAASWVVAADEEGLEKSYLRSA